MAALVAEAMEQTASLPHARPNLAKAQSSVKVHVRDPQQASRVEKAHDVQRVGVDDVLTSLGRRG